MPRVSLRESELKDILDTLLAIRNDTFTGSGKAGNSSRLTTSSISKASRDLIMSFPVLCEDSIDPRTATMVSKAIERKCVTMMQILLSANNMSAGSGVELIKKWHNNMSGDFDFLDNYMDAMDALNDPKYSSVFESRAEAADHRAQINEAARKITRENLQRKTSYQDSISESSLMGYKVYTSKFDGKPTVISVNEAKIKVTTADKSVSSPFDPKYKDDTGFDLEHKRLLDTDVRKANELQPSLMVIRYMECQGEGQNEVHIEHQFVAGVKTRLIPVDSFDLFDRIKSKTRDSNELVNLIRATTKEISFVKDYLLAIDQAKMDAIKVSKSNTNGIFKALERRATKSVFNRLMRRGNDASCITSMVISKSGADYIKKDSGIDLMNPQITRKLMDSYNLLCFVIVDESIETASFLFDGDSRFEQLSFNALERETGDGSYKKVINLLSKINR